MHPVLAPEQRRRDAAACSRSKSERASRPSRWRGVHRRQLPVADEDELTRHTAAAPGSRSTLCVASSMSMWERAAAPPSAPSPPPLPALGGAARSWRSLPAPIRGDGDGAEEEDARAAALPRCAASKAAATAADCARAPPARRAPSRRHLRHRASTIAPAATHAPRRARRTDGRRRGRRLEELVGRHFRRATARTPPPSPSWHASPPPSSAAAARVLPVPGGPCTRATAAERGAHRLELRRSSAVALSLSQRAAAPRRRPPTPAGAATRARRLRGGLAALPPPPRPSLPRAANRRRAGGAPRTATRRRSAAPPRDGRERVLLPPGRRARVARQAELGPRRRPRPASASSGARPPP